MMPSPWIIYQNVIGMKVYWFNNLASCQYVFQRLTIELKYHRPTTLFRRDERKFDVEGSYNIRYEIIKKRLDKVRVKDTGERLTQPGKIAMVYSNQKEVVEYQEYIEFLKNKNILKPGVELLELEELQGVKGMKAMRVEINLE